MGYWLGIDVGSTFTAAAVCRSAGGAPEVVTLDSEGAVIPSVVYLGEGGQVLVGRAALRRGRTDPDRVVRAFTQRIGDEVPMLIGGQAHTAAQIAAILIRWVIEQVTAQEAGPATDIVLTHPAGWGTYKIELLAHALHTAGLPPVRFATEPDAAVTGYAAATQLPVRPGHTIAVYDLGGATFDAAVGRHHTSGITLLGQPHRLDALGGADFDDAVFTHVLTALPALADLDPDDPAAHTATAALRLACTQAKEALSADTEVTIPVLAPGISTHVRLHRAEFEDLIRPQVEETVRTLRRAVQSAQLDPSELDVVVLVGGSSRVPLVTQLVSAELGRPIVVGTDPRTAIALGAARCAVLDTADPDVATDPLADGERDEPVGGELAARAVAQAPERPALTSIPLQVPPQPQSSRRGKRLALVASLALLTAAAATVPFLPVHSAAAPQTLAAKPPITGSAPQQGTDGNHTATANQAVTTRPAITSTTLSGGAARAGAIPVRTASSRTKSATTATPVSDSGGISSAPTGSGGAPLTPESGTTPAPAAGSTPLPAGGGGTATPSGSGATTAPAPGGGATSTPSSSSTPTGGNASSASDPGDTTKPAPAGGDGTGTTNGSSPTTSGAAGSTPSPSSGATPPSSGDGSSTPPPGQSDGASSTSTPTT